MFQTTVILHLTKYNRKLAERSGNINSTLKIKMGVGQPT